MPSHACMSSFFLCFFRTQSLKTLEYHIVYSDQLLLFRLAQFKFFLIFFFKKKMKHNKYIGIDVMCIIRYREIINLPN